MNDNNSLYQWLGIDYGRYKLCFNQQHDVFAAHFPDNPIVPAAYMIDIALEICQQELGDMIKTISLREAKFLVPLTPDKTCLIELSDNHNGVCKINISDEHLIYAKMSFTYLRSDSDL
ncbi:MAG TPA: hypothetical protein DEO38_03660 [Bacteroidales bacterium]|nr:hypothetical protein [Bacteroidales bacterium]